MASLNHLLKQLRDAFPRVETSLISHELNEPCRILFSSAQSNELEHAIAYFHSHSTATLANGPSSLNGVHHKMAASEAIRIIQDAIHRYGVSSLALSFNGGKDCTVLLDLFCSILEKRGYRLENKVKTLYVVPPDPFEEVEDFVEDCLERYLFFTRLVHLTLSFLCVMIDIQLISFVTKDP